VSSRKLGSTGSSSMASGKRECPHCHVPLVWIQSKQPKTKDQWFVVCLYNVKVSVLDIANLSLFFSLIAPFLCAG
jgi:ssDNA-binding Zn-finger/Zn-ribbon topoisomerase 1